MSYQWSDLLNFEGNLITYITMWDIYQIWKFKETNFKIYKDKI